MQISGRMQLMQKVAEMFIDSLTINDFVGVVDFDNEDFRVCI